jgi:hypothetical protein
MFSLILPSTTILTLIYEGGGRELIQHINPPPSYMMVGVGGNIRENILYLILIYEGGGWG